MYLGRHIMENQCSYGYKRDLFMVGKEFQVILFFDSLKKKEEESS